MPDTQFIDSDSGEAERRRLVADIAAQGSAALRRRTKTTTAAENRAQETQGLLNLAGQPVDVGGIIGQSATRAAQRATQANAQAARSDKRLTAANQRYFDALSSDVSGVNRQLSNYEADLQKALEEAQAARARGGGGYGGGGGLGGLPPLSDPAGAAPSNQYYDPSGSLGGGMVNTGPSVVRTLESVASNPRDDFIFDFPAAGQAQAAQTLTDNAAILDASDRLVKNYWEQGRDWRSASDAISQVLRDSGQPQDVIYSVLTALEIRWREVFNETGQGIGVSEGRRNFYSG